ncbi:MAG: endonuclease NucS [Thermofilum sp.]
MVASGHRDLHRAARGKLVLRAVRLRPHEELVVEVEGVLMLVHARLTDEEELEMYGSEEEILDALAKRFAGRWITVLTPFPISSVGPEGG